MLAVSPCMLQAQETGDGPNCEHKVQSRHIDRSEDRATAASWSQPRNDGKLSALKHDFSEEECLGYRPKGHLLLALLLRIGQ
jgi:hypothetical protein